MTGWARSNFGDHRDGFDTLHAGLTVELMSTPREHLQVCRADDRVADVIEQNIQNYDYLPVVRSVSDLKILGLFHTKALPAGALQGDSVAQNLIPLSEDTIIGADSSILEFVSDADQKPCRLVVSGASIVGLVSLSDLQRLPVRAALFALITGFEITLLIAIRKWYRDEEEWLSSLSEGRREILEQQKAAALARDTLVEALLFTQFSDKKQLVLKKYRGKRSKASLKDALNKIERLRNFVAHANDYAPSPEQATEVCAVVRSLVELRSDISVLVSDQ
ncbi:hypothetical protein [Bradyrhizobium sp. JYMT SZCCT0180]|uniref:hypothetical protein n=1 Tax=Bradyrhizobium sp. JYMT SZCCT0180 TaxID=2807666 RepID=UPI001BADAE55|nr:hypothetical protein [Bradyrhizobium sp. JYMT SZCCT0180]MBR1214605.1 hypothetical protein [Bradyrhizobium sp. JYMT SZCCT0180]